MVNYDAARIVAKRVLLAKALETQGYTAQLHKAQQAAESALDMYMADFRRQLSLHVGLTIHVSQVSEELCLMIWLLLAALREGRQCPTCMWNHRGPSASANARAKLVCRRAVAGCEAFNKRRGTACRLLASTLHMMEVVSSSDAWMRPWELIVLVACLMEAQHS